MQFCRYRKRNKKVIRIGILYAQSCENQDQEKKSIQEMPESDIKRVMIIHVYRSVSDYYYLFNVILNITWTIIPRNVNPKIITLRMFRKWFLLAPIT